MIQSELGTYVTPVVVLPPEEPIDTEGALIDTSDTNSLAGDNHDSIHNGSLSPDALTERYKIQLFYIKYKTELIENY